MDKKTKVLIDTLTGAIAASAIGLVTYFDPANAPAITASISVVESAVLTIVGLFTKEK